MKKKYLFCTKIWFYLTEIPLMFILYITSYYNFNSDKPWQFLPIMLITLAVIIYIGIYFFRMISVSYSEIRYHGLFSSHDSAIINKDKTLIIEMRKKGKLGVYLYGNDGTPALFDGLKGEKYVDIYLFRGKAIGGKRAVKGILSYFEICDNDISAVFNEDIYTKEYDTLTLSAEKKEDIREIRIKFNKTL